MKAGHTCIAWLAICAVLVMSFSPVVPATAQQAEQGTVRILLTGYNDSPRIDIGVYGDYLLDGHLSFQSGSQLQVTTQGNKLLVYFDGAVYRTDTVLRLLRHGGRQDKENGLRIGSDLPLYEGDLWLTAQEGKIRPVLHIGIEDYLKGVVPYEMSDSFPLEALKAQAVAARTYAIRGLRSDRDYDLTDDTNDQVYKGYNPEHLRAAQAVTETAGMCLSYQGEIIRTYYTASNGGQTESSANAWGHNYVPYLRVQDDPYDAQNPESEVRSFTIPSNWNMENPPSEILQQLLMDAIISILAKEGYDTNPLNIRVDGVVDVTAHSPRFEEESKLMTRLSFDILVSGRKPASLVTEAEVSLFSVATQSPAPTPVAQPSGDAWGPITQRAQPIRVDLPLYPDLEKAMGLSINLKENETISVITVENGFQVRSARYGHGVGLSQRGAEWMAKQHAKTFQEILSFYYPGTDMQIYTTQPAARPALHADFLTTPGPIPTATPRPTLVPQSATAAPGQWRVVVNGISRNSSLNLRLMPSTSSDVIYQLYYGQHLLVLGKAGDGQDWLHVVADDIQGYVMESFVERLP